MENDIFLKGGIPTIAAYQSMSSTQLYTEMKIFSSQFANTNRRALRKYRWMKDSFYHWSRQWEYPFVYRSIEEYFRNRSLDKEIRILDAGSGCTFFPYFISEKMKNVRMYACDSDPGLSSIYEEINANSPSKVIFDNFWLQQLDYKESSIDLVYCISVLEHTADYEAIIKEFHRIIRPGGFLILTFDIDLSKKRTLDSQQALILLETVESHFSRIIPATDYKQELGNLEHREDILNTVYIKNTKKDLLPYWRYGKKEILKNILSLKFQLRPFWNLTVYCGVWSKQVSD